MMARAMATLYSEHCSRIIMDHIEVSREDAERLAQTMTATSDQKAETLSRADRSISIDCSEYTTRIAVVVSHPIQYFAPLYRSLGVTPGIVLKVFFCSKLGAETYYDRDFGTHIQWDIPLLDGYDSEFLESPKEIRQISFWTTDNPKVSEALERFQPEVVFIHGYSSRTIWRTVRWCNKNQVPVMLFSDSNGVQKQAMWKRIAKSIIVKSIYRHLDGAFSCGDNNRTYHLQYGIPAERIFAGTMPIDSGRLVASIGNAASARREIRERHGIPEDAFVVVYAGKLTPLKNPSHLLDAMYRCTKRGLKVWGLLVGEGPERHALERFISEHKMENIVLAGFVNQSSIGKYYAASEVLALMSRFEQKGLVVPEAGCCGCPAILSDRIGCIGPTDAARPGENALVYPWSDVEALADCVALLCEDRSLYQSMSKAALELAASQDVAVAAAQIQKAALQLKRMGCRK